MDVGGTLKRSGAGFLLAVLFGGGFSAASPPGVVMPFQKDEEIVDDFCFNDKFAPNRSRSVARAGGEYRSKGEERVWYVNRAAAGDGTGESWELAFNRLEDALASAMGGDEVWVAAGRYVPSEVAGESATFAEKSRSFAVPRGVGVYGGFSGQEAFRHERNAVPSSNGTELSGDLLDNDDGHFNPFAPGNGERFLDNSQIVVLLDDPDDNTVLDGFTISGARGIYGGGIVITGPDGHRASNAPRLENLEVVGNHASYRGGGLNVEGGYAARLTAVRFSYNEALSGGGLYSEEATGMRLVNVTFERNKADISGGGASFCLGTTHIEGCLFRNNEAFLYGGGVHAMPGAIQMIRSTLEGNYAGSLGGGLSGYGNIASTVFRGNHANFGGAMYLHGRSHLVNVLAVGNKSDQRGGAILTSLYHVSEWSNLTLAGNNAGVSGAAVYFTYSGQSTANAEYAIHNSLITGNGPSAIDYFTQSPWYPDGFPTWRHSLIEGSGGSGDGWDAGLGTDGGGNLDADPLFFQPLAPEDAPTTGGIYRVRPGSPALNGGNNALRARDVLDLDGDGNTEEFVPFDLTGLPRVRNGIVDMGAFEGPYPNRYPLAQRHTADMDGSGAIGLSDLLRVIQLFNSPGYHCNPFGEGGFALGREPEARDCPPHSSDYNPQDWRINLSELLRLVQIFNTGGYYQPCSQGEDGFCPGPGE